LSDPDFKFMRIMAANNNYHTYFRLFLSIALIPEFSGKKNARLFRPGTELYKWSINLL